MGTNGGGFLDHQANRGDTGKTIAAPYNAASSSGSDLGPNSKPLMAWRRIG
jgi:hypothetical protein